MSDVVGTGSPDLERDGREGVETVLEGRGCRKVTDLIRTRSLRDGCLPPELEWMTRLP
jgi:hypothetical protein